jgi:hypothetical protein
MPDTLATANGKILANLARHPSTRSPAQAANALTRLGLFTVESLPLIGSPDTPHDGKAGRGEVFGAIPMLPPCHRFRGKKRKRTYGCSP